MDLAGRLKHIEALRVAREAKRQLVEQYSTASRESTGRGSVDVEAATPTPSQQRPSATFQTITSVGVSTATPFATILPTDKLNTVPVPTSEGTAKEIPVRPFIPAAAAPSNNPAPATEAASISGWAVFQRGNHHLRAQSLTVAAHPVCALSPSLVLPRSNAAARRRIILDTVSMVIPYDGAGEVLHSPTTAVCVAASYGGGGTESCGYQDPGNESWPTASMGDPCSWKTTAANATVAGSNDRAQLMEFGFPWGASSSSTNGEAPLSPEAMQLTCANAPGLVLTWTTLPLQGVAEPNRFGLFASPDRGEPDNVTTASSYVVVVVPLLCDSEVTSLIAHPFKPSVLIGGTHCGRIVQWTIGASWSHVSPQQLQKRAFDTTGAPTAMLLPPQRPSFSSFPSLKAHQSPVLRMAIHGDASCHHLYSISQEGKVCSWSTAQPLNPTTSHTSFLGSRAMGAIGVTAQFAQCHGTDAMTKVFIGTSSGALLRGVNSDKKSIGLQYVGPPRPVPGSSTIIGTLDITAIPNDTSTPAKTESHADFASSGGTGADGWLSYVSPNFSAPHHGRITALALQPATHGYRTRECIVSAATDGSCVAWFGNTVQQLEGFSSVVTSLCWSPVKPGVLAAGDTSGVVTLWIVHISVVTPAARFCLRETELRSHGSASVNPLLWSSTRQDATMEGDNEECRDEFDDDEGDFLLQDDNVGAVVSSLTFSVDGQWLLAGTACGYVYLLKLRPPLA